jgi:hypothetical protein
MNPLIAAPVFFLVYFVCGLLLFFQYRTCEFIRKRHPTVILIQSTAGMVIAMVFLLNSLDVYTNNDIDIPCYLGMFLTQLFAPLWMFSFFLRCVALVASYTYQQQQLMKKSVGPVTNPGGSVQATREAKDITDAQQEKKAQPATPHDWMNTVSLRLLYGTLRLLESSKRIFKRLSGTLKQTDKYVAHGLAVSKESISILLGWIFMLHLVYILAIMGMDLYALGSHIDRVGCLPWDFAMVYFDTLLFMISAPVFLIAIRKTKESLYIQLELRTCISIFFIAYVLYIVLYFGSVDGVKLGKATMIDHNIPLCVTTVVIFFLNVYLPVIHVLWANFASKRAVSLTSEDLDRVLADAKQCKKLKDIAAKELALEYILFLEDIGQAQYEELNPLYLYEKYVQPNSEFELNIPGDKRAKLTCYVSKKELKIEHFNATVSHVRQLVLTNTFMGFVAQQKRLEKAKKMQL